MNQANNFENNVFGQFEFAILIVVSFLAILGYPLLMIAQSINWASTIFEYIFLLHLLLLWLPIKDFLIILWDLHKANIVDVADKLKHILKSFLLGVLILSIFGLLAPLLDNFDTLANTSAILYGMLLVGFYYSSIRVLYNFVERADKETIYRLSILNRTSDYSLAWFFYFCETLIGYFIVLLFWSKLLVLANYIVGLIFILALFHTNSISKRIDQYFRVKYLDKEGTIIFARSYTLNNKISLATKIFSNKNPIALIKGNETTLLHEIKCLLEIGSKWGVSSLMIVGISLKTPNRVVIMRITDNYGKNNAYYLTSINAIFDLSNDIEIQTQLKLDPKSIQEIYNYRIIEILKQIDIAFISKGIEVENLEHLREYLTENIIRAALGAHRNFSREAVSTMLISSILLLTAAILNNHNIQDYKEDQTMKMLSKISMTLALMLDNIRFRRNIIKEISEIVEAANLDTAIRIFKVMNNTFALLKALYPHYLELSGLEAVIDELKREISRKFIETIGVKVLLEELYKELSSSHTTIEIHLISPPY